MTVANVSMLHLIIPPTSTNREPTCRSNVVASLLLQLTLLETLRILILLITMDGMEFFVTRTHTKIAIPNGRAQYSIHIVIKFVILMESAIHLTSLILIWLHQLMPLVGQHLENALSLLKMTVQTRNLGIRLYHILQELM